MYHCKQCNIEHEFVGIGEIENDAYMYPCDRRNGWVLVKRNKLTFSDCKIVQMDIVTVPKINKCNLVAHLFTFSLILCILNCVSIKAK